MAELQNGPWYVVLTRIVRDVGFPVFVAGYLLLQLGPAIERLTSSVANVTHALELTHDTQVQLLEELRRRTP